MSNPSEFFVAGGTLGASAPSYVVRPADRELLDSIRKDAFCYVLTARQMGKTSLMVRTSRLLRDEGIQTAIVDISSIGVTDVDSWYSSLLSRVQSQLGLAKNVVEWWHAQRALSPPQRFVDYVREVLLKETSGNIVIFIDEIDTMLRLDFRDDFFAAIRAMYNARASEPIYKRLTFVLLGVATPLELIRDPRLTPFNIGQRIELEEFSYNDLAVFRRVLDARYPGQAELILQWIFLWTNGHPYLTQKLCLAVVQSPIREWSRKQVEQLVAEQFLGRNGSDDANLNFVRRSIAGSPAEERGLMQEIYQKVYSGASVPHNESSLVQNHLELFGLVRVERGKLQVRNEIYRRVFDQSWIRSLGPGRPNKASGLNLIPWLGSVLVIVLLSLGVYIATRPQVAPPTQTQTPIAIVDTPSTSPTYTPPTLTVEPVATTVTVATTVVAPVSSETPTLTPSATPTLLPPSATPTATATPVTPTPTEGPVSVCTVLSAVTVRAGPFTGADSIGSLPAGAQFRPPSRSNTPETNWVQVPPDLIGGRTGWVYAGDDLRLVSCTNIELVPDR